MIRSCLSCCLCVALTLLLSACNSAIDPSFDTEQRYKHELYSGSDCLRLRQSGVEFNCWETVQFNPDGTADLLLGGGDIVVRGTYQREGKKITVRPPSGLPKEIIFNTVADDELIRADNATKWLKW